MTTKIKTLTDVKDIIKRFKRSQADVQKQAEEIRAAIEAEKRNLADLSGMSITFEDHLVANKAYVSQMETEWRQNIKVYLKGDRIRNEQSAFETVRSLDVYLRRFGLHSEGRAIYIPYVLAAKSWKNVAVIVQEKLSKMDKSSWGPYSHRYICRQFLTQFCQL